MITLLRITKVAIHLSLVFAAFLAAYEVRQVLPLGWWLYNPQAQIVFLWGALFTLIAALVELVMRTERASWRYASVREVLRLTLGTAITTATFLVILFLSSRAEALPRSTPLLAWILSLFALVGVRLAWRLRWDPSIALGLFSPKTVTGIPLTLVGDIGEAEGWLRRWAAGTDREYRPIAILAPGRRGVGQVIHGIPVMDDTRNLTRRLTADAVKSSPAAILFLADPITAFGLSTGDIGQLKSHGYRLLRQASLVELHGVASGAHGLREMKLEEFLPRAPLALDPTPIADLVHGKRVLVTGAGGSIGSEIARQLVAFGCSHISLIDHSEFALFEIHRELSRAAEGSASLAAILCNVRDAGRIRDVFAAERPDLVFHAAALKHVTLVENNPCEGVLTNVVGTWNVAAAARECAAREMVMISTDKAVCPTNIMGATKRLAESLLLAHSDGDTRYSVVRFGNVLGSTGSVVPIFKDQIERGGPVTVTHQDVERFFMTIPEAVQLVLHATALRLDDGDTGLRKFVLEMGQPVKIIDLARQMIELNGAPFADVAIEITGLRAGEKLTEELFDENEIATPCAPGITEIRPDAGEGVIGRLDVSRLATLAQDGDARAVRDLVAKQLLTVRGCGKAPGAAATVSPLRILNA